MLIPFPMGGRIAQLTASAMIKGPIIHSFLTTRGGPRGCLLISSSDKPLSAATAVDGCSISVDILDSSFRRATNMLVRDSCFAFATVDAADTFRAKMTGRMTKSG